MFRGNFRNQNSATAPIVGGNFTENQHTYKPKKVRETSVEQGVELARKWLQEQPTGRISKSKLKVASRLKGHNSMARAVEILLSAGELVRYSNGQLAKPESKGLRLVE